MKRQFKSVNHYNVEEYSKIPIQRILKDFANSDTTPFILFGNLFIYLHSLNDESFQTENNKNEDFFEEFVQSYLYSFQSNPHTCQYLVVQGSDSTSKSFFANEFREKAGFLQINHALHFLEAFTHAKTNTSDNDVSALIATELYFANNDAGFHSSKISLFPLEINRLLCQNKGERNYHIFYMLLTADVNILSDLHIRANAYNYPILYAGNCTILSRRCEKFELEQFRDIADIFQFSSETLDGIYQLLACILHLSSVHFDASGSCENLRDSLLSSAAVEWCCEILVCRVEDFIALVSDYNLIKIANNRDHIEFSSGLIDKELAQKHICNLMASIYTLILTGVLYHINNTLLNNNSMTKMASLKTLTILQSFNYNFNTKFSYDALCINYASDVFLQAFLNYTIINIQNEYINENFMWTKIEVDGEFPVLMNPYETSQISLEYLAFVYSNDAKNKIEGRGEKARRLSNTYPFFRDFTICHFQTEVTYDVDTLTSCDCLFDQNSLNFLLTKCKSSIISEFSKTIEPEHFKPHLTQIADFLAPLTTQICQSSHILCLNSNTKTRLRNLEYMPIFQSAVSHYQLDSIQKVINQTWYVSWKIPNFWSKYEIILKQKTKNIYEMRAHINELLQNIGLDADKFHIGEEKIFISDKFSDSLIENALNLQFNLFAIRIQSIWRKYSARNYYLLLQKSALTFSKYWRGIMARKFAVRIREASNCIGKFILGYKYRHQNKSRENSYFLWNAKIQYLLRLKNILPFSIIDFRWPNSPNFLTKLSDLLSNYYHDHLVRCYLISLNSNLKTRLELATIGLDIFRDKKSGFEIFYSLVEHNSYLSKNNCKKLQNIFSAEYFNFAAICTKFSRKSCKPCKRIILLTHQNLILLNLNFKIKETHLLSSIREIKVSNKNDFLFVLNLEQNLIKKRGDLLLYSEHIFEILAKISRVIGKSQIIHFENDFITYLKKNARNDTIRFQLSEKCIAIRVNKTLSIHYTNSSN